MYIYIVSALNHLLLLCHHMKPTHDPAAQLHLYMRFKSMESQQGTQFHCKSLRATKQLVANTFPTCIRSG